jgi:plastocyanin
MRKVVVVTAAWLALSVLVPTTGCAFLRSTTGPLSVSTGSSPKSVSSSETANPRRWNETVLGTPVDIADSTVTPGRVYIKVGATVTWVNHDSFSHKILIDAWNLSSGVVIPPGGRYSQKFDGSGTYAYHDAFHPVMGGEVVVE